MREKLLACIGAWKRPFLPNVRLRFNPKEGNDLYLVFNDFINIDRQREWSYRPLSGNRAIVLKYTFTFVM